MSKNRKRIQPLICAGAVAVVLIAAILLIFSLSANKEISSTPEGAVSLFYESLFPQYDEKKLERSVHTDVFSLRFDDGGYFTDRLTRSKEQLAFYYGDGFKSTLSEFSIKNLSDSELSSVKTEYAQKYSLEIEEAKAVSFTVTLCGAGKENARTEEIKTIKIHGAWYVYDYDAYWFSYM